MENPIDMIGGEKDGGTERRMGSSYSSSPLSNKLVINEASDGDRELPSWLMRGHGRDLAGVSPGRELLHNKAIVDKNNALDLS